jgi:acetate kinase
MSILVINSGSSSVKYGTFDPETGMEHSRGMVDIGGGAMPATSRRKAIRDIVKQARLDLSIKGIGHRVVHGGDEFRGSVRIDRAVLESIRACNQLAPLHNPVSSLGIEIATNLAPQIPQVAVFDTAFFSGLPESAWRYALPKSLADKHRIRRYGFHGISHQYVVMEVSSYLGRPADDLRLISLHLGNGASAAAVQGGRCVETSMGLTPLEGLVMGSRAGDLDPSILIYLQRSTGMTEDELEHLLNRESGLRGLCGETDMRVIKRRAEDGDMDARLAREIFVHRVRKYIGAYTAVLGGVDALAFTGGIGEHDSDLRAEVCKGFEYLGIRIEPQLNLAHERVISPMEVTPSVMVITTNEELAIAREAGACLGFTG